MINNKIEKIKENIKYFLNYFLSLQTVLILN